MTLDRSDTSLESDVMPAKQCSIASVRSPPTDEIFSKFEIRFWISKGNELVVLDSCTQDKCSNL